MFRDNAEQEMVIIEEFWNNEVELDSENQQQPFSDNQINVLETINYPNQDEKECSICLDELKFGTLVKRLPCDHIFHDSCIVPWLKINSTCPFCRQSAVNDTLEEYPSIQIIENQNID